MAENFEKLNEHIKACIAVFITLMCLTVITVAVSYLRLPEPAAISVALCIALVKGSMVVSFFMHMISEKKLIFLSLSITATFFIFLMILPIATDLDIIRQTVEISH